MKKAQQMAHHTQIIHLIYNNNIFRNKIKKQNKWQTIQAEFTNYIMKYLYKLNKQAHQMAHHPK